ncbi:MAG: tetratricopeptide repeat protein [Xanthomonadales bacterium]|nr:tetratricopeptide repeat protein [Gammaproteobacteria bacterium]MBT8053072.1 tetratricopeptide repeat protein [Gammaproteobacteria bacterium]NND56684.1 tetratricopeptide repeat protein [Xanthomonadales bacterium]NNK52669.1 tetratricopeptide repeat protein [Xanthomonadales bacterium]
MVRKSGKPVQSGRYFRLCLAFGAVLLLGACASTPDSGSVPQDREVDARVREPAKQDSEGVQVFPLQNPAVKELLASAGNAESNGDFGQAATLLERALRIQPRDPEILQSMAEVQLQMKDYGQALNFASRSYDVGPRVGEICSRNWRTISVSREHLGDHGGAAEAEQKAMVCMKTKPRSL